MSNKIFLTIVCLILLSLTTAKRFEANLKCNPVEKGYVAVCGAGRHNTRTLSNVEFVRATSNKRGHFKKCCVVSTSGSRRCYSGARCAAYCSSTGGSCYCRAKNGSKPRCHCSNFPTSCTHTVWSGTSRKAVVCLDRHGSFESGFNCCRVSKTCNYSASLINRCPCCHSLSSSEELVLG